VESQDYSHEGWYFNALCPELQVKFHFGVQINIVFELQLKTSKLMFEQQTLFSSQFLPQMLVKTASTMFAKYS